MKCYNYKSYKEYLDIQYKTNEPRIPWTIQKKKLRLKDIQIIKKRFKGKRCVCLGCRHDIEVEDFEKNEFNAIGIDILPTNKQILGDINKLEQYFTENEFDFAYSAHSLEHTYNPIHFLQSIRKLCREGLYLVVPIRDYPDVEEPIFFDFMHTRKITDVYRELKTALGDFKILDHIIRDDPNLPSGAEMCFVIKWK